MSLSKTNLPKISVSYNREMDVEPIKLTSSQEVYKICKTIFDSDTIQLYEEFKVLYLDRGNCLIGYRNISRGSTVGTVVNIQLIIRIALECNAQGIILVHNHPSGGLKPSIQDRALTKKLKEGCEFFEIQLLDHLIVTHENYSSFADDGWL